MEILEKTMYDIIYLYDLKKENRQFKSLKARFPLIKVIKYDNDIYEALIRARKSSMTKFFWIVNLENDHVINDDFNFDYVIPKWDQMYVHVWKTSRDEFKSVYLISKDYLFTKREADYLFFINKKEMLIEASRYVYDIIYLYDIKKENRQFNSIKERFPLIKVIKYDNDRYDALTRARKNSITKFFWIVNLENDHVINDDFYFDYVIPKWDQQYVHVWKTSRDEFKSVYLISKDYLFTKREADYLFFINKKEIPIEASRYGYDVLRLDIIDNFYEKITAFQQTARTSMFWVLAPECKLLTDLTYIVPDYDKEYVHQWTPINNNLPNVFLIPSTYPISKREADHLFFISKKIMEEKISKVGYDVLQLGLSDTITSFKSTTSMFWVLAPECKLLTDLTYIVPDYDKEYVHQWTASNSDYLHLNLIPKNYPISKREATALFFVSKKEMPEKIFKEIYDMIFISYNELNAEENWLALLDRFPEAKRLHGIKGIHNAHKQAATLSKTSMFWVIDGDSQIVEDFNFDYVVYPWDKDAVFVWKSKNPINDLTYGNGGIKLLPKTLTMDLDTSTIDMTTSISKKFNSMDDISNWTMFNTDPFNTWRSAFRECVKLSSKAIDGQIDQETTNRLNIWCSIGIDKLYGEFSIKGAIAGKEFGLKYFDNKSMLANINDWEWLIKQFENSHIPNNDFILREL